MKVNVPTVKIGEVKELIGFLFENKLPSLLYGHVGVGKTTSIKEYCMEAGINFHAVYLTQIDQSDLKGIIMPNKETGLTELYPNEEIPLQVETSKEREWEYKTKSKKGILLLDEFPSARPDIQVSATQLLLERRLGKYKLEEGWLVLLAGNLEEHGTLSYELPANVVDRLSIFYIDTNQKDFLKMAEEKNIHPLVISYIKVHPENLHYEFSDRLKVVGGIVGPTPRTWHIISDKILKPFLGDGLDFKLAQEDKHKLNCLLASRLGEDVSKHFLRVIEDLEELPKIQDLYNAKTYKAIIKLMPSKKTSFYNLTYVMTKYIDSFGDNTEEQSDLIIQTFKIINCLFNESKKENENELPYLEVAQTLCNYIGKKIITKYKREVKPNEELKKDKDGRVIVVNELGEKIKNSEEYTMFGKLYKTFKIQVFSSQLDEVFDELVGSEIEEYISN